MSQPGVLRQTSITGIQADGWFANRKLGPSSQGYGQKMPALYRNGPGLKNRKRRRWLALSIEAFEGMRLESQRYGI
jgi:hypothetical protein